MTESFEPLLPSVKFPSSKPSDRPRLSKLKNDCGSGTQACSCHGIRGKYCQRGAIIVYAADAQSWHRSSDIKARRVHHDRTPQRANSKERGHAAIYLHAYLGDRRGAGVAPKGEPVAALELGAGVAGGNGAAVAPIEGVEVASADGAGVALDSGAAVGAAVGAGESPVKTVPSFGAKVTL